MIVQNFLITSMLVTHAGDEFCCWQIFRCWWWFWPFWSTTFTIFLHYRRSPTFNWCQQHRNSVTNIHKSWPTLSHQHHDVAKITVTILQWASKLNVKILIVYKCLLTVYLAQIKGSYMFIQNRQLLTVSISVPFYRGVWIKCILICS